MVEFGMCHAANRQALGRLPRLLHRRRHRLNRTRIEVLIHVFHRLGIGPCLLNDIFGRRLRLRLRTTSDERKCQRRTHQTLRQNRLQMNTHIAKPPRFIFSLNHRNIHDMRYIR